MKINLNEIIRYRLTEKGKAKREASDYAKVFIKILKKMFTKVRYGL
jgi:hypothetical protein